MTRKIATWISLPAFLLATGAPAFAKPICPPKTTYECAGIPAAPYLRICWNQPAKNAPGCIRQCRIAMPCKWCYQGHCTP